MPPFWDLFCNRCGQETMIYTSFSLGVGLLASAIRSGKSITGLSLNSEEFKLSQYAADTTCLVEDNSSTSNLFRKLDLFRLCLGLELNRSKTDRDIMVRYKQEQNRYSIW